MILFSTIFNRAFNLFDDPDITKKYYYDAAGYQHIMLQYLMIAKDKFTTPTAIVDKLHEVDEAVGYNESDNGDGTATYVLDQTVANQGVGVGFTYKIGNELVKGEYDPENNSVTFPRAIQPEETWSVTWFYAGAFTADFSSCLRKDFPMPVLMDKIVNILAYGILSVWGDQEVGRVLEVRNILTDNDFKMYSPANSARAKVEWRNQMNRDMDTLISELNWRIMGTPSGGSKFGK